MLSLELEPPNMGEAENCCICRRSTRTWYLPKDVAMCRFCASFTEAANVPDKETWIARERAIRESLRYCSVSPLVTSNDPALTALRSLWDAGYFHSSGEKIAHAADLVRAAYSELIHSLESALSEDKLNLWRKLKNEQAKASNEYTRAERLQNQIRNQA